MRTKWYVVIACLTLAFILAPAPMQGQVHAWEGTITIPTYQLGAPDPNPPFPLINRSPVYPYQMQDNLTDNREPQTYLAIYLENKYLKITVLPELGGHVYSVYDKIDHREVFYRDNVIKYGLVGPRGAWIAGGMEFSFPIAHTTDTVSTVESVLHHNPDGSATSVVGAIDWVSNMHWEIAITLRPNTARVEEGVTLFNSTPENHLYLFWTNTAVKATDDAQYIYPMRETVFDDPFATVQSWSEWKGVDRSWYKNDPDALAIFARNVHRNFFGMYYHDSNFGVVHVADFRQDPGKKFWTWGTARSGKIWDKILSDNDGSYNEIQSGRFYTQGSREFMNPHRVEKWTEYWYPVRGLDTGFVEASNDMAINTAYTQKSGQSELKLTISPVAEVKGATVVLKVGANPLHEYHNVNLTPLEPAAFNIPIENAEEAQKNLNVQIVSAQGDTLLQWSAADPIDGNPDLVPSVGKEIKKRIDITDRTPVEELYLQGVFLQKTENEQGAIKIFDQVLQRDPGYVPALLKEAWYYYQNAEFKKAESLIERAIDRDNDVNNDASVAYASGVIDRADGQLSPAKNAFWNSVHYGDSLPAGATLAASFVQIGEISIRQGRYSEAIGALNHAVSYNPNDAFALADMAVAQRLAGNSKDAARYSAEAVQKMPLLPYALAEQWQSGSGDTSWTKIVSSDPENYLAIASWYHNLGAWKSSDAVLHVALDKLSANDASPMIYYYLASNAREQGNSQQAGEYAQKAASLSSAEVFPNRLTDAAVLEEAIQQNPADAKAKYALGNFMFSHDRYDEAATLWTKSLDQGFNNPVLLRNLAVYEQNVKKDPSRAADFYRRAIQLSPNDYRLYTALDEVYEQQGDNTARETLFRNAPPTVLDQDTVRARRAVLSLEQDNPDAALALLSNHRFKPWEGGVAIHNMFVHANIEKGKQALANHKSDEAIEAFRKAMDYPEDLGTGEPSHPDKSQQLYWLGNALQAQGKNEDATEVWNKAAKEGTVYSALAYRKLGQNEKASQLLNQHIEAAAQPDATAEDYFSAGLAERYSGNAAQARANFQKALEMNPLLWQARIELNQSSKTGSDAA